MCDLIYSRHVWKTILIGATHYIPSCTFNICSFKVYMLSKCFIELNFPTRLNTMTVNE